MSRKSQRRYRKRPDRRIWVFSELNQELRPDQIAKILTAAGLEQARLEIEAANARRDEDPSSAASFSQEVPRV